MSGDGNVIAVSEDYIGGVFVFSRCGDQKFIQKDV